MDETPTGSLNHFAIFRFTVDYWRLPSEERDAVHATLMRGVTDAASAVHWYQLFPTEMSSDFMIWSASSVDATDVPGRFFRNFAEATTPVRQYVEPRTVLWGMTRPSQYSKARSRQEIEPYATQRTPYLIVYPFAKTSEWYLMTQETRQGMMNDHIRIGKQYTEIKQLLLYSFGLQDQEFVVVYEADDLAQFSALVHELRMTEARRYTLMDAPVHTALHRPPDAPLSIWS